MLSRNDGRPPIPAERGRKPFTTRPGPGSVDAASPREFTAGAKRVDAVVERHARVAGREAGAVALRLGEADVDVAVDRQRRRRPLPSGGGV